MAGADRGEDWDAVGHQRDALPAGWRRHARRAHLDLLEAWVGRPTGRWLKTDLFEERSPERALLPSLPGAAWVGVDVSPVVVRGASAALRAAVVADVRALPFRPGSFDGVLSTSTLDHFDDAADIDRSLRELASVLRRGGRLVVTFDNAANPLIGLRNALPRGVAARTGLVPFAVGVTVDEAGGRAAIERAGLTVEASAHLLHAPHVVGTRPARFAWWERRALPWFDRLASTRLARWSGHYVALLARS